MKKSFWLLIILAILIVVFSVQNASPVFFTFLAWNGEISLAVLLIITFILGAIVGAIYQMMARKAKNKKMVENVAGDIPFDEKELKENE